MATTLKDLQTNGESNCCGAKVYNDTCADCKEHCEAVVRCSNNDCQEVGSETVILNGRSTQVCAEHKRTTDLGNWQGIEWIKNTLEKHFN